MLKYTYTVKMQVPVCSDKYHTHIIYQPYECSFVSRANFLLHTVKLQNFPEISNVRFDRIELIKNIQMDQIYHLKQSSVRSNRTRKKIEIFKKFELSESRFGSVVSEKSSRSSLYFDTSYIAITMYRTMQRCISEAT